MPSSARHHVPARIARHVRTRAPTAAPELHGQHTSLSQLTCALPARPVAVSQHPGTRALVAAPHAPPRPHPRGGILALSSCSSHIDFPLFHQVWRDDAGRPSRRLFTCGCALSTSERQQCMQVCTRHVHIRRTMCVFTPAHASTHHANARTYPQTDKVTERHAGLPRARRSPCRRYASRQWGAPGGPRQCWACTASPRTTPSPPPALSCGTSSLLPTRWTDHAAPSKCARL